MSSKGKKGGRELQYHKQSVPKFLKQFSHILNSNSNNNYLNEEIGYQSNDEEDEKLINAVTKRHTDEYDATSSPIPTHKNPQSNSQSLGNGRSKSNDGPVDKSKKDMDKKLSNNEVTGTNHYDNSISEISQKRPEFRRKNERSEDPANLSFNYDSNILKKMKTGDKGEDTRSSSGSQNSIGENFSSMKKLNSNQPLAGIRDKISQTKMKNLLSFGDDES